MSCSQVCFQPLLSQSLVFQWVLMSSGPSVVLYTSSSFSHPLGQQGCWNWWSGFGLYHTDVWYGNWVGSQTGWLCKIGLFDFRLRTWCKIWGNRGLCCNYGLGRVKMRRWTAVSHFHTRVALMRGAVSTEIVAVFCFRVSKTLANSPDFSSPQSEFQQTLHSSPYKYYWVLESGRFRAMPLT